LPNWAGALSRSRTTGFAVGIHVERYVGLFESFGVSTAILPVESGIQYFGRWSAQKIARQPGHGEYGNTSCATRHIAKKAALSKQNTAHFPMIKF
jgi:hypothetical protein